MAAPRVLPVLVEQDSAVLELVETEGTGFLHTESEVRLLIPAPLSSLAS